MPSSAAIVTGMNEKPRPIPASRKPGARSIRYEPCGETCVNHRSPAVSSASPTPITFVTPTRVTIACDAPAEKMIVTATSR